MPQRTIALLDRLTALGFSDSDFQIIHHFGSGETIRGHRRYCERTSQFRAGSTNETVQRRLAFVLNRYAEGGYTTPPPRGTFGTLCEEALRRIPR